MTPAPVQRGDAAVYDANVLYPATLRDLLVQLATTGLFRAKWTEVIHDEWTRSILAKRPDVTAAALARTRQLMDAVVPDCLVSGYEPQIDAMTLPDPDDRHVLAAAVHAGAEWIVTLNLRDFPPSALEPHEVAAVTPDAFVCGLLDLDPGTVADAVTKQRRRLRNPPRTVEQHLERLRAQGLPHAARRLTDSGLVR